MAERGPTHTNDPHPDVCLVTEARWPTQTGGLTTWIDHLRAHVPDVRISVACIDPEAGSNTPLPEGDREAIVAALRADARRVLDQADMVTTACRSDAHAQRALAHVEPPVIPNPAPATPAPRPAAQKCRSAPLVGYVGRVAALKDTLSFVRAAAQVQHPTAHFVVVGPLEDETHAGRCIDEADRPRTGRPTRVRRNRRSRPMAASFLDPRVVFGVGGLTVLDPRGHGPRRARRGNRRRRRRGIARSRH